MGVWEEEAKLSTNNDHEQLHQHIHVRAPGMAGATMDAVFWVRNQFPENSIRREFFDGSMNVFVFGPLTDHYAKELRLPAEHIEIAKIALSNGMKAVYDLQYADNSGKRISHDTLTHEVHSRLVDTLKSEGIKFVSRRLPFLKGLSTIENRIITEFVKRALNHIYLDQDRIVNSNR